MLPPLSCARLSDSSWRGDVGISCYVWQSYEVETRPAETCLLHLLLLLAPLPACLRRSPTPDPKPLARSAAHCPPSLPPAAGLPKVFLPSTAWSKKKKKTHTGGFRGTGVTMGTHSLEKLFSFVSAEGILCVRQKAGSLFSFSGGEQNNYSFV